MRVSYSRMAHTARARRIDVFGRGHAEVRWGGAIVGRGSRGDVREEALERCMLTENDEGDRGGSFHRERPIEHKNFSRKQIIKTWVRPWGI